MARAPDPYFDFVEELLSPLGPMTIKRMFGGAGVYSGGVMFALIADDELYLKADRGLADDLVKAGSEPFTFQKKDGQSATMSYYRMPSDGLENSEDACAWARRALDVALKAKRK